MPLVCPGAGSNNELQGGSQVLPIIALNKIELILRQTMPTCTDDE